jgi:hypothetical protein
VIKYKLSAMESGSMENTEIHKLSPEYLTGLKDLYIEVRANLLPVLEAINAFLEVNMQPRSEEYHLTIISPAERKETDAFDRITATHLVEFENIERELQNGVGITVTGIGYIDGSQMSNVREADKGKKACFIALDIPRIKNLRHALDLPEKDLHITLGFEDKDIHLDANKKLIEKKADPKFDSMLKEIPALQFGKITGHEKEKKELPTPRPGLLDIVTIDGRVAQVGPMKDEVQFLDEKIKHPATSHDINWNDFDCEIVDTTLGTVREILNLTHEEFMCVHWGPEEKENPGIRNLVTFFGVFTRKKI